MIVQVNGKQVRALLDTGADNNFLNQNMVDRLELNLSNNHSFVKTVNSKVVEAKVSLMPYLRGILIGYCENPCFIQADESLNKQEKEAYSEKGKGNMVLDRRKCVATLETKHVVAESKREVDDLQASKVSCSGPVQFKRKQVGDCSKIGRGLELLVKHEGRMTVENKLGLGSKQVWREFEASLVCGGKQAWQIKNKLGLGENGLGWEIETSLAMWQNRLSG
ncbi:hypothetical protein LWI28_028400 [Acer negundo]|uniref:Peptidase A2 domain-containing protein n=1 Tax=Acer negundo TaxID=4023 RepID=A0AAD5IHM2_ACENE|nr:hypothetical protein LWI28_028400 [Acer negundo]